MNQSQLFTRRETCRICGSRNLHGFLDLGRTALANRFLGREQLDENEPDFRLDVHFCEDCTLVQLLEIVDADVLFRDYIYVSGTSETMRRHFADFADSVRERFQFPDGSLIVEAASNDGTFLSNFEGHGLRLVGVEPATNIAQIARDRGIETVNEFFGAETGRQVREEYGAAKCVLATNVFAHVDDVDSFVDGADAVMAEDGIFIFENSYIRDTLDGLQFDSVYHEHMSYYSITALTELFRRHEMEIFDVERTSVHGGSIRVFVQRKDGPHPITDTPERMRREERDAGICDVSTYMEFGARVYALKDEIMTLLRKLKSEGKQIVAYGSSAKGNTLLNFFGIGSDLVDYIVDKNPMKQGTYSPGMHIPVLPTEKLREDQPDYALILAWNFTEEILRQQEDYIAAGGHFIVPAPSPRIVPS